MARYTDAVCRLCRREGRKLFLKGERCDSPKCAINKRNFPPGQHGLSRNKVSQYGQQLREKQKAKRIYGVLEKQFHHYFEIAERHRGVTGHNLMQLLERRLDNIVYRLGFASSRSQARQLVSHGNVTINGKRVNIPSYLVKPGEAISIDPAMRENISVKKALENLVRSGRLGWLDYDSASFTGKLKANPSRPEIPVELDEQLIVELYSK